MTTYLNMKTSQGVETVDEFTKGVDAPDNHKEFNAYIRVMISEYNMAGMSVYRSSRSTKDWKN